MCQDCLGRWGKTTFCRLWWWGGKRRKCSGFLGYLLGVIPAQLREKSETASKVVDSLRHLKGGRLRACFAFFTPLGMYPKDPHIFSVFLTTAGVFSPVLKKQKKTRRAPFHYEKRRITFFLRFVLESGGFVFGKSCGKQRIRRITVPNRP